MRGAADGAAGRAMFGTYDERFGDLYPAPAGVATASEAPPACAINGERQDTGDGTGQLSVKISQMSPAIKRAGCVQVIFTSASLTAGAERSRDVSSQIARDMKRSSQLEDITLIQSASNGTVANARPLAAFDT